METYEIIKTKKESDLFIVGLQLGIIYSVFLGLSTFTVNKILLNYNIQYMTITRILILIPIFLLLYIICIKSYEHVLIFLYRLVNKHNK